MKGYKIRYLKQQCEEPSELFVINDLRAEQQYIL
jgi:hypothetical protein